MIKKIRNLLTVILFAFTGLGSALAQPVKFALCYDISKAYTFITPQLISMWFFGR
jgi:branched-chain amino acid transport system substrate-binding protein